MYQGFLWIMLRSLQKIIAGCSHVPITLRESGAWPCLRGQYQSGNTLRLTSRSTSFTTSEMATDIWASIRVMCLREGTTHSQPYAKWRNVQTCTTTLGECSLTSISVVIKWKHTCHILAILSNPSWSKFLHRRCLQKMTPNHVLLHTPGPYEKDSDDWTDPKDLHFTSIDRIIPSSLKQQDGCRKLGKRHDGHKERVEKKIFRLSPQSEPWWREPSITFN